MVCDAMVTTECRLSTRRRALKLTSAGRLRTYAEAKPTIRQS